MLCVSRTLIQLATLLPGLRTNGSLAKAAAGLLMPPRALRSSTALGTSWVWPLGWAAQDQRGASGGHATLLVSPLISAGAAFLKAVCRCRELLHAMAAEKS